MIKQTLKYYYEFHFKNRKRKLVFLELVLFFFILGLNELLKLIIPIAQWPLKTTDENYWVFMLFACCEAILIGLMVLLGVLGVFWLVEWLRDKKKDDQNVKEYDI